MTCGAWRLCRSHGVWLARPSDVDSLLPDLERVDVDKACSWLRQWFSGAAYERSLPWDLLKEMEGGGSIGISKRKLRKRVKRALRDGRLIAFVAPATAAAAVAASAALVAAAARRLAPSPPPPARPPVAERRTWIGIALQWEGVEPPAPAALRPFRLELTDGTVRAGLLDMNGQASFRGLEPGTCTLGFPGAHGDDWWPEGAPRPAPGAPAPPRVRHDVRQGDHVSRLAAGYGFADHRDLWDGPANADLRAARPGPDLLAPGDVVAIPEHVDKAVELETGSEHRFVMKREALRLGLRLQDRAGAPIAGALSLLEVDRAPAALTTDGEGVMEREIARRAVCARLLVEDVDAPMDIGWLDPIDLPAGWLARLENLGYLRGAPVASEQLAAAIEELQYEQGCPLTGEMDEATRAALLAAHGC